MKHQPCPYLCCKIWISEAISIVTAEELLDYMASMSEDVGCISEEILFYASIFSLHVRGLVTWPTDWRKNNVRPFALLFSYLRLQTTKEETLSTHSLSSLNLESFNSNTEENFRKGTGGSLILIFLC